jgi:hypothetical protein
MGKWLESRNDFKKGDSVSWSAMAFLSRHPLLVTGIIIVVILSAWVFWQMAAIRQESEYHEYHYQVSLSTQSVLRNVTLLLPVPFLDNTSPLGEAMVRGEGYGIPPSWRLSLEQVNNTPMLNITAGIIVPEYHGYPIPLEWGQTPVQTPPPVATAYSEEIPVLMPLSFGISQRVQESIDTRDPINREPLFSSPGFLTGAPCPGPSPAGRCYRYRAPVFVQYSGGGGNLTLTLEGGGTNSWWLGGWSGNSYSDSLQVTLDNSRQGWVMAEGLLSTGPGRS